MNALRKIIPVAAVAAHMAAMSIPSLAQMPQKFPTKTIRLLVAYAPGGSADAVARMIGEKMSASWGHAVVLDHRPGAGGVLAASALAKATPDGHTLLFDGGNFSINAVLRQNLPYHPLKNFAGISGIGFNTTVMVVAPAVGVKSVNDLIELAKAHPGKVIFAASTAGSGPNLSAARFHLAAGIKTVTVAFKGAGEQIIEVLAGRIHYTIVSPFAAMSFIKEGKLLPLAVFIPQRSPLLPDVPAMAEILPDFKHSVTGRTGLLAPAGTPRAVLHQISKEAARILDLPDIKERLLAIGIIPVPSTPEEHDKFLREHLENLTVLIRDAGLKPK